MGTAFLLMAVALPTWQWCKSWSISRLLQFFLHYSSLITGKFPHVFGKKKKEMLLSWNFEYKLLSGKLRPVLQTHAWSWFWHWGENREKQNIWMARNIFDYTSVLALHEHYEVACYSSDLLIWLSSQDPSFFLPCCCTCVIYIFTLHTISTVTGLVPTALAWSLIPFSGCAGLWGAASGKAPG